MAVAASLMVEGTGFDLQMAGIAVSYGVHSREALIHYGRDDIRQLPQWLERHASTAPIFDTETP